MTKLSVNVNKLATLRNSRGKNNPNVALLSAKILDCGAHSLTVHPRPDGRHIRLHDVEEISGLVTAWNLKHHPVEFNVEGYPSDEFLALIDRIRPDQCTLVPDPPEALTSDAGWDFARQEALLERVLEKLRPITRVSLFADPKTMNSEQAAVLSKLKPHRIELYTEAYADAYVRPDRERVTAVYRKAADEILQLGIGLNAGHDLNQENLGYLISAIPELEEVSIGHALICEALERGLETTVKTYLRMLNEP